MTVKMTGNGHSFLECTRYNSHRLSSVEANDQWRLCSFIGPIQQYFKKKTFPFDKEESAFPSKQCTGSHVPGTDKFKKFRYELLPHPAYLPNLAPNYFLFPNLKK